MIAHLATAAFLHGRGPMLAPHHFRLQLGEYLNRVDIPVVAVLECLAGAMCFAISSVLQQSAARAQPDHLSMRPGLIFGLVRSWRWMLGNLMDVGGFLFQFLALRHAALALVEPLFVIGLVFSIVGAALIARRRPTRREWWSSFLVAGGLALFVSAAQPGPGHPRASDMEWAALFAVTAAIVGGSVLLAAGHPRWRALLLGAATGILYGVTSAVTERTAHLFNAGVAHMFSSWAPYTLAVISIVGLLLNQSAYQAGELRLSLPVITVAEPIIAIVIGQALFGEHIGSSAPAMTGEIIGLVCMTIGVVRLSRLTPAGPAAPGPAAPPVGEVSDDLRGADAAAVPAPRTAARLEQDL
jgi:drug/metabolite transporter (DMT)-like permease